jgi:hypothetical protein
MSNQQQQQRRQPQPNNPPRNQPLPGNERQDVGATLTDVTSVPEVKVEDYKQWVSNLYDVTNLTDDIFMKLYETFSYKGFNRNDVLKQLYAKIINLALTIELIVATALRGPQAAATLILSNGRTPLQMGIPASGGQGSKTLTLNKIQAATADLAAFFLKRMNVPKRLDMECPGWLQFPSAGSIRLPANLRRQHREFAERFSVIIGGNFQPQIYEQMERNCYLDEGLRLFD